MDNCDLMRLYADVCFTYDARGRMLESNEPCAAARRSAPRLYIGYTTSGCVVRFRADVPDALAGQIEQLIDGSPPPTDLLVLPPVFSAVRRLVEQHAPITEEERGPHYVFPDAIEPSRDAVQLTDANVELARESFPWLITELADWWPCFAVVCDARAVSICFSSRMGPGAAAAGVETLAAYRRRGFAAAVTAAWAAEIRASGRIPFYSTSWENRASMGVAQRLALALFGAEVTLV